MTRILYTPRDPRQLKYHSNKKRTGFVACVIIGICVLLFLILAHLSFLRIRAIRAEHTETLNPDLIIKTVQKFLAGSFALIFPRDSIFFIRTSSIRRELQRKFPQIASITVTKELPSTIAISLTERKLWGIFCNDLALSDTASTTPSASPVCMYIDRSGFAYGSAPASSGFLIMKISTDRADSAVGASAVEPALMDDLRAHADAFKKNLDLTIVGYQIYSKIPSEIRLITSEGFMLILKRDDPIDRIMPILKKLLTDEIKIRRSRVDYIDLRFGNKVFYKFK